MKDSKAKGESDFFSLRQNCLKKSDKLKQKKILFIYLSKTNKKPQIITLDINWKLHLKKYYWNIIHIILKHLNKNHIITKSIIKINWNSSLIFNV